MMGIWASTPCGVTENVMSSAPRTCELGSASCLIVSIYGEQLEMLCLTLLVRPGCC